MDVIEVASYPLMSGWIVALAQGWQLGNWWHAGDGNDGHYCVRLWREVAA